MLTDIRGYEEVCVQVGFITLFHDDEILSVTLQRHKEERNATLQVEVELTGKTPAQGRVVSFIFDDVSELYLDDFNHQNVLSNITAASAAEGIRVRFNSIFGADLSFACKAAAMSLNMR